MLHVTTHTAMTPSKIVRVDAMYIALVHVHVHDCGQSQAMDTRLLALYSEADAADIRKTPLLDYKPSPIPNPICCTCPQRPADADR